MGHSLGMDHDFDQDTYDSGGGYVYRKYETETDECRGLMDYVDDGVGWSKCSARDFSRTLTEGGSVDPQCLTGKYFIYIVFYSGNKISHKFHCISSIL